MATIQRDSSSQAAGPLAALAGHLHPTEPQPMRGPFTRWPRTADAVLAGLVFVAALLSVAASQLDPGEAFTVDTMVGRPLGAYLLLAVACVALFWRRAHPVAVAATVFAAGLAWAAAGYGDGEDVTFLVAVYGAGRYCTDRRVSFAVLVAAFSTSVLGSVIDASQRVDVWPAVVVTALPWYVGVRVRERREYLALLRERAERREAEEQARTRAAVADERARIARELHDVVAHQVSMMTVQAGAAKMVAREDLDAAVGAMGDVETAGRRALGELRHLLGVLRPLGDDDVHPGDDPADDRADDRGLGPQPRLADVPSLVERLRDTGAEVHLTTGELPELSTAVDLSAFRIVQEAVTNVLKHAGRHPRVDVSVTTEPGWLDLRVTNTVDRSSAPRDLPTSGYGLAGMRERAGLLGGTLSAERTTPDVFTVHARLPLPREAR